MPIEFIAGIVSALFLLLLLLFNLKDFRLTLSRIYFGKYSYKYVAKFKKIYFMENPYPVCIQDDLVSHLLNFSDPDSAKQESATKTTITFGTFDFYTKFDAVVKKSTPVCFNIYKLSDEYTVKVIGFPIELMGSKIKELYFFINDSFFMGEYIFSDVSKINSAKLIDMLISKYKIPEPDAQEPFHISDAHKSRICYNNNGFYISIQYINSSKPFVNTLLQSYLQRKVMEVDLLHTPEGNKEIFARL